MTPFRLMGDVEFLAEDIEDALRRLGEYYVALADGKNPSSIFIEGEIDIWRKEAT